MAIDQTLTRNILHILLYKEIIDTRTGSDSLGLSFRLPVATDMQMHHFIARTITSMLCLVAMVNLLSGGPAHAGVIYVGQHASGAETNGQRWATAFRTINEAMRVAQSGDEVWVAAGPYYESVRVPSGVALYGGFAGTETQRSERNWTVNKAVVNAAPLFDGYAVWDYEMMRWFKPQSPVVLAPGFAPASRVDGFYITGGWHQLGGGIYVEGGSPVIANNVIAHNTSDGKLGGGGVIIDTTRKISALDAIGFFTNTANLFLREKFGFGLTNIPVYPTNYYTPAVHQLLQLAANLYDATRPQFNPNIPESFPSVFRPRFRTEGGVVYISDYYLDSDARNVNTWLNAYPHGIPFVIGAKKGLPNFNEYAIQTAVLVARKLELERASTNIPPYKTNEMYIVGISNFCGVEFWNSYQRTNDYPIELMVGNVVDFTLSNEVGGVLLQRTFQMSALTNTSQWREFPRNPIDYRTRYSFQVPLSNTVVVLENSAYRPNAWPPFDPVGTNRFDRAQAFHTPNWILGISNRLTCVVGTGNRILDFVHLANLTNTLNISELTQEGWGMYPDESYVAQCFQTNRVSATAPPQGIIEQMNFSLNPGMLPLSVWQNHGLTTQRASGDDIRKSIEVFESFVFPTYYGTNNSSNLVMQAPFSPARKLIYSIHYQVNDPLVNDLADHLIDLTNSSNIIFGRVTNSLPTSYNNLGTLNMRYSPWGGNPLKNPVYSLDQKLIKDQAMFCSDDWDFPADNEVNLRWLDRVHRGTPWQTVYLGAGSAPFAQWRQHFLDINAHPTNDWRWMDLFRLNQLLTGEVEPSAPSLVNNTITRNEAQGHGGGILALTNTGPRIVNDIIADNSSGVWLRDSSNVVEHHNCVSGNVAYDFEEGRVPGTGDIATPPQFANVDLFEPSLTSPCIDAGDDSVLANGWVERGGPTAIYGAHIDMGAHEYNGTGRPALRNWLWDSVNASMSLQMMSYSGQTCILQTSEDLTNWVSLSTNVLANGQLLFPGAGPTNSALRFYRAVTVP